MLKEYPEMSPDNPFWDRPVTRKDYRHFLFVCQYLLTSEKLSDDEKLGLEVAVQAVYGDNTPDLGQQRTDRQSVKLLVAQLEKGEDNNWYLVTHGNLPAGAFKKGYKSGYDMGYKHAKMENLVLDS